MRLRNTVSEKLNYDFALVIYLKQFNMSTSDIERKEKIY